MLVFLMRRRPPRSTRTDTLFPYTPLFRSRQLFNENFDVPAIGRFVIGRYWRAASPADQKAFLKVFEDAMVQRFLPLLAENSSERFQVGTVTPDNANANMAWIDSRINRWQGELYRVVSGVRHTEGTFNL